VDGKIKSNKQKLPGNARQFYLFLSQREITYRKNPFPKWYGPCILVVNAGGQTPSRPPPFEEHGEGRRIGLK
jgi:hypothetical protein